MKLLAFDTSTERMSVAVRAGARQWLADGPAGAQASATLIPTIRALLGEADLTLGQLDAIVFGRGPGSFTGLRTACAVAQGLAFGAGVSVLPLDTLLALAEDARQAHACTQVLALLDARMDQVYAAAWSWSAEAGWSSHGATVVCAPEALTLPAGAPAPWVLAGNAFAVHGARLPAPLQALPRLAAMPTAEALLRLAPAALASGGALPPEQALPLYVRDKVALTTAERMAP